MGRKRVRRRIRPSVLSRRLLLLTAVVGLWLYYSVSLVVSRSYDAANQLHLRSVLNLTAETLELLAERNADLWSVQQVLSSVVAANPQFGFYALDGNGSILLDFAGHIASPARPISGLTLERYFKTSSESDYPLYIESPSDPAHMTVFAARRIRLFGSEVILLLAGNQPSWRIRLGALTLRREPFWMTLALLPTLVAGGLFGAVFMKRLRSRTESLVRTAKSIAQGDLEVRHRENDNDELGEVVQAFNAMAETVDARITDLRRREMLRKELVENFAHDMKSPLSVIHGYCERLDSLIRAQPAGGGTAEGIRRGVESLHHLLQQLNEFVRIDTKSVRVCALEFDLQGLIKEILCLFQGHFAEKNLLHEVIVHGDPSLVKADPALLERVFMNLIENAIRYTSPGGVVAIHLLFHQEVVEVEIHDSGLGISEADATRIFARGVQGSANGTRHGQSGLGLAIVQGILEAHGREISLGKSQKGGACFGFTLPLALSKTHPGVLPSSFNRAA